MKTMRRQNLILRIQALLLAGAMLLCSADGYALTDDIIKEVSDVSVERILDGNADGRHAKVSAHACALPGPSRTIRQTELRQLLIGLLQSFYSSLGKILNPTTATIIIAPIETILKVMPSLMNTSPTKIAIAPPLNISIRAVPSAFLRVLVKNSFAINESITHASSLVNSVFPTDTHTLPAQTSNLHRIRAEEQGKEAAAPAAGAAIPADEAGGLAGQL